MSNEPTSSRSGKSCDGDNNNRSKYRDCLPAKAVPRNDITIWSILKNCIGKELSKIAMPIAFNEPLSFLQRLCEHLHYSNLLNIADQCIDPIERMEYICAFVVSSVSNNNDRLNKPFNPLLGETYELVREDLGFRFVAEQVSHHPPISAYHAESKNFRLRCCIQPKLKFWGKSVEVKPEGCMTLTMLNHDEVYTWKGVNCCVHNVVVGKLWFEQYGTVNVVNHKTGAEAVLSFKPAGWFGRDLHRVEGFIQSKDKKHRFVYGKWTNYLKSVDMEHYEQYMKQHETFKVPEMPEGHELNGSSIQTPRKLAHKLNNLTRSIANDGDEPPMEPNLPPDLNGEIPKSDSSSSLDIPNSTLLWVADSLPEISSLYYGFNPFTYCLNQLTESMKQYLPPTDSRLRSDIRLLESGEIDRASDEKCRLEEKQRETRKNRKKLKTSWTPMWFKPEKSSYLKENDWVFAGGYWDRNYENCPNIF